MLEYLRINSLALIDDVELEFAPGLNVLTGETGAGKSFILKALNFLTGDKLGADLVRPGQEKARVEALFSLPDGDVILRRELAADTGRSRVFINDGLASQEAVKQLRSGLILHTSQHGQQRLLQPAYQARILDGFLEDQAPLEEKDRLLKECRALLDERQALVERSQGLEEKRDLLEYQRSEIDKVGPGPNEEEELDEKRRILRDRSAAEESLSGALSLLLGEAGPDSGIISGLDRLDRHLATLAEILPDYAGDRESLADTRQHLQELDLRLRRQKLGEPGEDSLEKIEARLFELAQLKRKLKRSLPEILALQDELEANLSFLDSCALDLKQVDKRLAETGDRLAKALEVCNAARQDAGDRLTRALEQELRGLGFSEHVRVLCEFTAQPLFPDDPAWARLSEDRARFLWMPNPGQAAQPLDRIASGGELSRFLLAVVGLMARAELPTLIFDEVDSGVGGVTLTHVGKRLQDLAGRQQVILISHWPQLASLAQRHFLVSKEVLDNATYTRCARLSGEDVFLELSRMAGGGEQGDAMAGKLVGR